MGWLKGINIIRHTGADLTIELLDLAESQGLKVSILNLHGGLSTNQDIESTLIKRWPKLRLQISSVTKGDWSPDLTAVKLFQPDIFFCALGAPFQDQLLSKILPDISAKIGIGVGGSFDYLTGRAKRAPLAMRSIGLEWLWRLMLNPGQRIKRIYNAVIKFPIIFIIDEFIHPHQYRPNVVGFIYQRNEVLIVNSAKEIHDFWKLPQGGMESGESYKQAIKREMMEELSLEQFSIKAIHPRLYKYDWPEGYSIRGYKGQQQTLCLIEYQGNKDNIKLDWENRDYKWVKISSLIKSVDPVLKEAYSIFIKKYKETI
jgi:exopolysaccharide biosynthesis WecB/TagA/CpsF family protein